MRVLSPAAAATLVVVTIVSASGTLVMYRAFLNLMHANRTPGSGWAQLVARGALDPGDWRPIASGWADLACLTGNTFASFVMIQATWDLLLFAGGESGQVLEAWFPAVSAFLVTIALAVAGRRDLGSRFLPMRSGEPFRWGLTDGVLLSIGLGSAVAFLPGHPVSAVVVSLVSMGGIAAVRLSPRLTLSNRVFFTASWRKGLLAGMLTGAGLVTLLRTGAVTPSRLSLAELIVFATVAGLTIKAYITTARWLTAVRQRAGLGRAGRLGTARDWFGELSFLVMTNMSRNLAMLLAVMGLSVAPVRAILSGVDRYGLAIGLLVAMCMALLVWRHKISVISLLDDKAVSPSQEPEPPRPVSAPMAYVAYSENLESAQTRASRLAGEAAAKVVESAREAELSHLTPKEARKARKERERISRDYRASPNRDASSRAPR